MCRDVVSLMLPLTRGNMSSEVSSRYIAVGGRQLNLPLMGMAAPASRCSFHCRRFCLLVADFGDQSWPTVASIGPMLANFAQRSSRFGRMWWAVHRNCAKNASGKNIDHASGTFATVVLWPFRRRVAWRAVHVFCSRRPPHAPGALFGNCRALRLLGVGVFSGWTQEGMAQQSTT